MAKPRVQKFKETNEPIDGWTKTSNALVEELYPDKKVSGALQIALLLKIARATWGADREPKSYTRLVHNRLADELKCSRMALENAINDALKRGLIESKSFSTQAKFFRLARWENVPKYEGEPIEQDNAKEKDPGATSWLFPGRHSRAIQLPLFPTDKGASLPPLFVYNELNRGIGHTVHRTDAGIVVRILSEIPKNEGEEKVNTLPSGLETRVDSNGDTGIDAKRASEEFSTEFSTEKAIAFSDPDFEAHHGLVPPAPINPGKRIVQPKFKFAKGHEPKNGHAPAQLADVGRPQRSNSDERDWNLGEQEAYYRPVLRRLLLDHWGKALDEKFLDTIIRKVDGASVELFERLVVSKLLNGNYKVDVPENGDPNARAGQNRTKHTTGILVVLAEDAAKAHLAIRQGKSTETADKAPAMSDEEYRAWAASLRPEDYADLQLRGLVADPKAEQFDPRTGEAFDDRSQS